MKKKIVLLLTAVMLCLSFALAACGGTGGGNNGTDHGDDTYYTVTFDSQGGSAVESQRVLAGNPVRVPSSPSNGELLFQGWFVSADANAEGWNFETHRVNGDTTLFAHWAVDTSEPTASITYEKTADSAGYIVTGAGQEAKIVIPATHDNLPVVGIGESAFAYSKHTSDILSVTIPGSVVEIGLNAFHNQDALVSVNIGTDSKLEKIGNNAFSGNSSLESIYLPAGFTELGDDVFNNCGALDTITVAAGNTHYSGAGNCLIDLETNTLIRGSNKSVIPETVEKIGVAAFRRATLTELTVPKSVTYIDKYAISDCAITKIIYKGTPEEWETLMTASSKYWNMGNKEVEIVYSYTAETSHILVAYFSATGTTKGVAEKIADVSGGTLYEIVPAQPYTQEDLAYNNASCRANKEQNDKTARPQIESSVSDMGAFDVVYLGYPIWWGKAPKVIYTFLESYEFAGKTIIPFCTSGSSPISGSLSDIQALASDATWLTGRRFDGGAAQSVVAEWVNSLNTDNN